MSTPDPRDRDALVAAILRATADLAAARVAYAQGVAERHGLAATDVEVLRPLGTEGAMPVGRVGELTALTTGATTRLIDRLEQAGFVRRLPDPADRRRVIVEAAADRATAVQRRLTPSTRRANRSRLARSTTRRSRRFATLPDRVRSARSAATPRRAIAVARATGRRASVGAPDRVGHGRRLVFVTGGPVTIAGARGPRRGALPGPVQGRCPVRPRARRVSRSASRASPGSTGGPVSPTSG